jgi:uncharacterized protein (DUF58 family)
MERVLPVLRRLNKQHLLLVVFFRNEELNLFAKNETQTIREIYFQMAAEKFIDEKEQIQHRLKLYGIQSIQTAPENLSLSLVNKYLQLKSRGMI